MPTPPPDHPSTLLVFTRRPIELLAWAGYTLAFALRALPATIAALPRPSWWFTPFYGVLIGALPLALVAGLSLGVVVWLHTRDVLAQTFPPAVAYLPTFLSAAVLLELAPIAAGLIVAARTGASLGAELASMTLTEQIDAMQLLGVSPLRRLVGPRVLACVLAVPLLHVLIAATAIGSGYGAELLLAGDQASLLRYEEAVLLRLDLVDVIPAGLKTMVFGLVVGIVGCHTGLSAGHGSEGVGRAATDGVVTCGLLVLAADVLLVMLIKAVTQLL